MRFCKDCEFYQVVADGHGCSVGDPDHHPVTGNRLLNDAIAMRAVNGPCGRDAILFSPIHSLNSNVVPFGGSK